MFWVKGRPEVIRSGVFMKKFLLILAICPAAVLSAQDAAPSPDAPTSPVSSNSTPATAADVQALRQEVQSLTRDGEDVAATGERSANDHRQNARRGRRSVFAKSGSDRCGENRFASACFRRTESVSDRGQFLGCVRSTARGRRRKRCCDIGRVSHD